MGIVLTIVVVQCVIAVVVIAVLKHLLDRELVEAALEKLQAAALAGVSGTLKVRSSGDIQENIKTRVQSLVRRKAPEMKIEYVHDPSLKGGLFIEWSGGSIDCGLAGRVKNIWS